MSISTLEHVGFDETVKDSNKILAAINNLKTLRTDRGSIIVTMPVGYNPILDDLLDAAKFPFSDVYFMKRISKDNRWIQSDWESVRDCKYSKKYPYANAIVIAADCSGKQIIPIQGSVQVDHL
ncbi:MAG: hypothetical protein JRN20_20125 [Nitrososphaerota archaeon]|nr:hypothetical protein [Nitrososphaerota archaeon]